MNGEEIHVLIVQEARGRVTNFYGEDYFIEGHHIIATNGYLRPLFQETFSRGFSVRYVEETVCLLNPYYYYETHTPYKILA